MKVHTFFFFFSTANVLDSSLPFTYDPFHYIWPFWQPWHCSAPLHQTLHMSLPASPALTSEFRCSPGSLQLFLLYNVFISRQYARPSYFVIGSKTKQVSSAKFTKEHNYMLSMYLVAPLQWQWLASSFLNKQMKINKQTELQ